MNFKAPSRVVSCHPSAVKLIVLALFVVLLALSVKYVRTATLSDSGSFKYHVGANNSVAWGSADIVEETQQYVSTNLTIVEKCIASTNATATTTMGDIVYCKVPTQTGTDRGKVIIGIETVGTVASGTTTVNYVAFGYGAMRQ